MKENKVAIYCRLSKEDLDKDDGKTVSESIKNQKAMLGDYANGQGWLIYDYYVDEDYCGSDRDRPEFNRLITDSLLGCYQIVLCKKQARFARDIEYVEKYVHGLFAERKIRFVALLDNIDTAYMPRSSKKTSQINSLVDEWYLSDLSDNITSSFNTKRKAGEFIGSWAPYGYKKDPENPRRLLIDEPAAAIVREIYNMYLNGYGIAKISEILSLRGVLSPIAYMKEQGCKFGSRHFTSKTNIWSPSTVATILDKQVYIGDMVQGRFKKASYKSKKLYRTNKESWIIKENTHDPIIDFELWETVQSIRKNKVRPKRSGITNIFASKLRCLECGELMHAVNYPKMIGGEKSTSEFHTSYRCSKKRVLKDSCKGSTISINHLKNYILKEINNLSERYFDGEEIEKLIKLADLNEERKEYLKKDLSRVVKSISDSDLAVKSLYMDKVKGNITESQFLVLNKQFIKDNERYNKIHNEIESEIKSLEEKTEKRQNMIDLIQKYREIKTLTREIVAELIDVVYIGTKDKATGERTIKIVWNI